MNRINQTWGGHYMLNKFRITIDTDVFIRCREEINKENRMAIGLLAQAGLLLSVINMFTQLFIVGSSMPMFRSMWLTVYFCLLYGLDRWLPEDYPHATGLIYVIESPLMVISILLGTLWDPTHQATTILLFITALPAFILDRPDRSLSILGCWSSLFLIMSAICKEAGLFHTDMFHIFEFYLAAIALTSIILRVRLESLRRMEKTQYVLDHDSDTDCLSRYALNNRMQRYLHQPVLLLLANLDQFRLLTDFYGRDAGDAMNVYFTHTLMRVFGSENTYRLGGDEVLCVLRDTDTDACLHHVAECQEALQAFALDGKSIPMSSSFGYVTGVPNDAEAFNSMLRLASIHVHKAKKIGLGQTSGGPFDVEQLRAGAQALNLSSHARAYEVNQLTGLPGMSYFMAQSDELLSSVADVSRHPVIGYFKLLNMRDFNGDFGYAKGDELIARAGELLREHFGDSHICHITAGQFGILCYREQAEPAIRAINDALTEYMHGYPVQAKAGFSPYTGTEKAISLMDEAKVALSRILNKRGEIIRFYDDALDAETQFQHYIINHLDEAMDKGYLKVYYQPIVRTVTGHVCNEEALSRWDDPHYGFLTPDRFIPCLEANRLMYKLNLYVVRQVLTDIKRRQAAGIPVVPVSVNLSRKDFEQCDMVQAITDMVDQSGLPHDLIKIEITESAFISNLELLKRELARFRENGFEIWLDDFGSEYSTLNLLQDIEFDVIKIDMQFMRKFSTTSKNFIIISDIIDMSKRLGITTLIEGIETEEHFQVIKKLGCEKVQGFLFNRPNPFDYIMQRAITGTGLRFETLEAAPYYAAIGRIDLGDPLAQDAESLDADQELPAGVVEWRADRMICLRGTDRFLDKLKSWGAISKDKDHTRYQFQIQELPEALLVAVAHCKDSANWVSVSINMPDGETISALLRRVSTYEYNGGTAVLVVLLRRRDT